MKINRHNYEEYFILYMDNELSSEDSRMVENFVQNNPDLKEELDILLQSKLSPDNSIVFEKKEELIKTDEGSAINMNNYEEWLILYLDNELSAGQKAEVEEFTIHHPSIKAELGVFSKTRLQPEKEIVFPDKQLLYRNAEKVRIIQMRWWKVAVAAILILAIAITGIVILYNRRSPANELASKKTIEKVNPKSPVVNNKETNSKLAQHLVTNEINKKPADKSLRLNNTVVPKINNNVVIKKKSPDNISEKNKKDEPVIATNNISNNLPQPLDNPNIKNDTFSDPALTINNTSSKPIISSQLNNKPVTIPAKESFSKKVASENTSQKPGATYANLEEGSNKKTRGFFRKAIRFFEKKARINPANDDDQVLIGGLAVKL